MRNKKPIVFAFILAAVLAFFGLRSLRVGEYISVDALRYDVGGFVYSGGIRDGLFESGGEIAFEDGSLFIGNFSEGRFDGEGRFYFADGAVFEGVFSSGEIDRGVFYFENGSSVIFDGVAFSFGDFVGGVRNGLASGVGEYRDADGRVIYQGGFENGMFHGYGVYYSDEGWTYKGYFAEGQFHGDGYLTREREIFRGVWENGVQVTRYE